MDEITVVGGGLAGLVAAVECAEGGGRVRLLEAGRGPGGRARTLDGPFRANLGAHVIYADGYSWAWLRQRRLLPRAAGAAAGPALLPRRTRAAHAAGRLPGRAQAARA